MYSKLQTFTERLPVGVKFLLHKIDGYLRPLLEVLDEQLDKRLVRTLTDVFTIILAFRERHMGLLLSEMGAYIMGTNKAPAGTKRISNLLRSSKWSAAAIEAFLFQRARQRMELWQQQGKQILWLWDDSRLEKPESECLEGLCPVYSSKGQRLTRIRPGYYKPPVGRICTPGLHWTAVVMAAPGQKPCLLSMDWWTTQGKHRQQSHQIIYKILKKIHQTFANKGLHIFDRGYANDRIIGYLKELGQNFLIRWVANRLLINEKGEKKKIHLIARSYKTQSTRIIADQKRKQLYKLGIAYAPVRLPNFADLPLTLIIIRYAKGKRRPIYWLTSMSIHTVGQAWRVCGYYLKRWNIEQVFRFAKSGMGIESPRLWFWENRLKLLSIVALVIDFLLYLLDQWRFWCMLFLQQHCPRTGNRCRNASTPIYRLRTAIASYLTNCWGFIQFSG